MHRDVAEPDHGLHACAQGFGEATRAFQLAKRVAAVCRTETRDMHEVRREVDGGLAGPLHVQHQRLLDPQVALDRRQAPRWGPNGRPAGDTFPLATEVEAMPLAEFLATLRELVG